MRRDTQNKLDLCRSRTPLATAYIENSPQQDFFVDVIWGLAEMPDSGSMQHNLLQEILKEGGRIPKLETLTILLLNSPKK